MLVNLPCSVPLVFPNWNAVQPKTQVGSEDSSRRSLSFSLKEQEREILMLRESVEIPHPFFPLCSFTPQTLGDPKVAAVTAEAIGTYRGLKL